MELKELFQFIKMENERMTTDQVLKEGDPYEQISILARTVKLQEEVGELAEQVLHSLNLQRKSKRESNTGSLEDEFADIILVTLFIADKMNVDVESAIERKIDKINKRYS